MKKNLAIIILALITLIIITACPSPPDIMGNEVIVINGHFIKDQIYDGGNWIDSYFSDGTYESTQKSWDSAAEKWVLSSGIRGTYEYDAKTLLMTRSRTHEWGLETAGEWGSYEDYYAADSEVTAWSKIDTHTVYYTGNGSYNVYTAGSDNTWVFEYDSVQKETRNGSEETNSFKALLKYTISGTELMFNRVDTSKGFGDTESMEQYLREWGGDLTRLAPTDIEWKSGKTVTFYYTEMVNRQRRWDWDAGEWLAWEDWTYNDIRAKTLTHMGDFMLEVNEQSMKSLY